MPGSLKCKRLFRSAPTGDVGQCGANRSIIYISLAINEINPFLIKKQANPLCHTKTI